MSTNVGEFNPRNALPSAMKSEMSSKVAGQNKSVIGQLKRIFLTKKAKTTIVPNLNIAIKYTKNASSNTSLTPEELAKVYDVSSNSMKDAKNFYLQADEIEGSLEQNKTFKNITSKVNELSDNVSNFAGSNGFDAAIEKISEYENKKAPNIEFSINKYEERAEKTLGVANLSQVLDTYKKVEQLLETNNISEEEIEAVIKKAVEASAIITGSIKAITRKTVLDDSKQTSSSIKYHLKERALRASKNLQAATLKVREESNGNLKDTLEGNKVIQESLKYIKTKANEVKEVEEKRKKNSEKIADTPEKQVFIDSAQKAYDNENISAEIKAHMQQTVIRALKLFPKVVGGKTIYVEINETMKPILVQLTLDVYSFYMHAAKQTYDIYEKANDDLDNATDIREKRQIIDLVNEKNLSHCEDLNIIYSLCIEIYRCYLNSVEESLKTSGGNELYLRYTEENNKVIQKDNEGRLSYQTFLKKSNFS